MSDKKNQLPEKIAAIPGIEQTILDAGVKILDFMNNSAVSGSVGNITVFTLGKPEAVTTDKMKFEIAVAGEKAVLLDIESIEAKLKSANSIVFASKAQAVLFTRIKPETEKQAIKYLSRNIPKDF